MRQLNRLTRPSILLLAALLCAYAQAQNLESRVKELRLKNGMTFLLVNRPGAPVFSAVIGFRVGGVDDPKGMTGLAHVFEHMAFKGNKVIGTRDYRAEEKALRRVDEAAKELVAARNQPQPDPKEVQRLTERLEQLKAEAAKFVVTGEWDDIYSRNGATDLNASTGTDLTSYYVSLPSNRLELWALMESQRIADPVLREFYTERDVVVEERRQRSENDPDGALDEAFLAAAFKAHPYGVPIVGWTSDLLSLTRPDAERFHRTYYVPGNAVGAVVGDLDLEAAARVIERYFGAIPPGPPPPPVVTREPPQEGERRVEVFYEAEPYLVVGWHKPSPPSYDDFVFDVIRSLLSEGRTSRLYTSLVKEKRMATGIFAGSTPGDRYANIFEVGAAPIHPHTLAELEAAIDEEVEKLKKGDISAEELQKVKNQAEASFIRGLQSNMGLASQLAYFQTVMGDWRYLLKWRDTIRKITAEDVRRVANQYLTVGNRTVALRERPPAAAPGSASAPEGSAP